MLRITLLFILLISCYSTVAAVENPWETRLPIESGLIIYKATGNMRGKKALYFKDFGRTTAEYAKLTLNVMGILNTENTVKITTPDWIYCINRRTKEGTKEVNPNKYLIAEFNKLSTSEKEKVARNIAKSGKFDIEGFQGKIARKAVKFLKYDCDIVNILGTEIYLLSGTDIPLRTVGTTMGLEIKEIATSIKCGNPPAKAFSIPTIRYQTEPGAERRVREQAQAIIQSLLHNKKTPEAQSEIETNFEQEDHNLPFTSEITDAEALRFREQQGYNDIGTTEKEDDKDQEEAAQEIQQGLKKMFKDIF